MSTTNTRGRRAAPPTNYESLRGASIRTGYSVSSIRGWIRAGKLATVRIGPAKRAPLRLRVADVDALVRPAVPQPTPMTTKSTGATGGSAA
jgi:hypothetical protein